MTLLQALDGYYDRMAARREVAPPGWSEEPLGCVLVLAPGGGLVGVETRLDAKGKKALPALVPKWFGRSGTASTPFFLWDNTAYALGVSVGKDPAKTTRDHGMFRELHLRELAGETDEGLVALRRFLETWTAERFTEPTFTPAMLAFNVGFRLDGEMGFLHQRAAARAIVERLRGAAASTAAAVPCLVTGRTSPPVKLHPKVKGVDGTASAEVPLVSFNADAFTSYGKEQGFNAPVSEEAAQRYGAALNRLLDRGKASNRLKVGDVTVAFWADASGSDAETEAKAAEVFFFGAFAEPARDDPADDLPEAARVREALKSAAEGRPASAVPDVSPGVRFHVLGLSPNAARISVRFWLSDSFGAIAERLLHHREDLWIEPTPWKARPPGVQRLLLKTAALAEKFENIPPLLAGELMRAIISGARYPSTLLSAAVMRLRAGDDPASGWHAAAIRAVLAREARFDTTKEAPPVSLDRESSDSAYNLGRVFALAEIAQRMALPGLNATIGDRYYSAASAAPAGTFPLLIKGMRNHLSKLRKEGKGGWIERELELIAERLAPNLPRSLALDAQGRFAIGYYHQRRTRVAGTPAAELAETQASEGDDSND